MKNTVKSMAILLCAALLMSGCSDGNRPADAAPAGTAAAANADDDSYGYGYGAFAAAQTTQQIIPASTPIGWFAEAEDKGDYTVMKVETSKGIEKFKLSTFKEQLLAMDTPTKLQTSNRVTVCDESGVQIVYTENADGGVSIDFCDVEVLKAAMDDSYCQVLHSQSTFFDMHMGTTTDYLTISEPTMKEVDSDITRSGCYKSVNDGFTVTAYTNGGYTYYFILDVEPQLLNKGSSETIASEQIIDSDVQNTETTISETEVTVEEPITPVIAESVSDFTYESVSRSGEKVIMITGLANKFATEKAVIMNIPEAILGDPVKYIDRNAFKGKNNIIEVNLPDNLVEIDNEAFAGLTSLKKVTFGSNISQVNKMVFKDCKNLSEVTFTNTTAKVIIYEEAFMDCVSLEAITIPAISGGDISTKSSVGERAFKGCAGLKTVTIKDGTSQIDEEAFAQCENIEEMILPDSVDLIGDSAFEGCTSLKKVSMNNDMMVLCSRAFYGCTSLKDVDFGNTLLRVMGADAFANCTSIETIVLPSLIESESTFTSTKYGDGMFAGCSALRSAVLPDTYSYSVPERAFAGCSSLEKIVIPQKVFAIRPSAFEGCSSLSEVQLPEFKSLEKDVQIGQQAFKDCQALRSITITGEGAIGKSAFENCTGLTDLNIKGVWIILEASFKGCTGLEKLNLQQVSWGQLDQSVFADCTNLTEAILSEGINQISSDSFARCTNLRSINIPDSINNYKWLGAFTDCTNITVTYKGEKYSYEDLKALKANMGS